MRAILIALSAAEEIALRKIHLGSSAISPDAVARLKERALIERAVGGWRLTPLGMRRYDELPDAPLRGRGPSMIDDILDRYIPLAQASGIVKPGEIDDDSAARASASPPPHQVPGLLIAEESDLEAAERAGVVSDRG